MTTSIYDALDRMLTKGRLTHAAVAVGTTVLAATLQDYDQMGRVKDYWQCTPVNCGSSNIFSALYNYDLAGDVISWNHPAGFTITQTPIDTARHITRVTSSLNDATHPGTLATGPCTYDGGSPGATMFDHPDALGSLSASTNYQGGGCQERLFYPFGESWTGAGNCGMHQEFGKLPDYDAETDQYNTAARHYTPMG
jgi:hypothetical protein